LMSAGATLPATWPPSASPRGRASISPPGGPTLDPNPSEERCTSTRRANALLHSIRHRARATLYTAHHLGAGGLLQPLTLISKAKRKPQVARGVQALAGAAGRGGGSAGRSHPAGVDRDGATAALHGRCAARRQPQRTRAIRRVDRVVDDVLTPGRRDDPQPQRAHARWSDRGPAPTPPDAAAGPAGARSCPHERRQPEVHRRLFSARRLR
jgi:hypothetical protein